MKIFPFRYDYANITRRYYYPPLNINHQKISRPDKLPCNFRLLPSSSVPEILFTAFSRSRKIGFSCVW